MHRVSLAATIAFSTTLVTHANAQPSLIMLPRGVGDVSGDGLVVTGSMIVPGAPFHAFRWSVADGLLDLGTLGGAMSRGNAVSADGSAITGTSRLASGEQRAFIWTYSTGMHELGTLGGSSSFGNAISADGTTIVGSSWYEPGSTNSRAFRWTAGGGMQDLGGGGTSFANDVSADGSVVVGGSSAMGAFRWTESGGMQSLGSLTDGGAATAWAVSAVGDIIAGFSDGGLETGMFRWTDSGGMQEIGRDGLSYAEMEIYSGHLVMSADGGVMGGWAWDFASVPGEALSRGWIWTASGGLMHLDSYLNGYGLDMSGWTALEITGMSFDGSVMVGGGVFEGEGRSWMATIVVPAPGGISLFVIALSLAAKRRRLRAAG